MDQLKETAWKDILGLAKSILFNKPVESDEPEVEVKVTDDGFDVRLVETKATKDLYLIGAYSNNFMDRESEILSEASHKEFVEWANRTGFSPFVVIHHQPYLTPGSVVKLFGKYGDDVPSLNEALEKVHGETGFGVARVERFFYLNGFAVFSAKVLDGKADVIRRAIDRGDAAMSHGFVSLRDIKDKSVHNIYRAYELTIIARSRAANVHTDPAIGGNMTTGDKSLSEQDRKYLSDVVGEDFASQLEDKTAKAEHDLQAFLSRKSVDDVPDTEDTSGEEDSESTGSTGVDSDVASDQTQSTDPGVDQDTVDEGIPSPNDEIVKEVMDKIGVGKLSDMLKLLLASNKALIDSDAEKELRLSALEEKKVDQDKRVADEFKSFAWSSFEVPSQSDSNVVTDPDQFTGPNDPAQKKADLNDDDRFMSAMTGPAFLNSN